MTRSNDSQSPRRQRLRSQLWFDNPDNPGMTALYLERYLNYGLTREELTSGKPIVGIAQTGSDLSPCNRHHLELAKRVREGIRDSGLPYGSGYGQHAGHRTVRWTDARRLRQGRQAPGLGHGHLAGARRHRH